jgi:hypothetical protein
MFKKTTILLAGATLFIGTSLFAKQNFPSLIPNTSNIKANGGNTCNTCHTNGGGSARNAFGIDVKKNLSGNTINWAALSKLDSDGDGFTNGQELQDPDGTWTQGQSNPGDPEKVTHPGNSNDKPTTVIENQENRINSIIDLLSISPNPISSITKIQFSLKNDASVDISIFNYDGSKIATLLSKQLYAGGNEFQLNINDSNLKLNPGIYLLAIKANGAMIMDKLIVE